MYCSESVHANTALESPVLQAMQERVNAGSVRGQRTDGRVIALAVEGGGSAGVISAGMCATLEATGLIDAVDVIYGTSSGALNGSFAAAGQARTGATNYEDTANRRFSNPLRFLRKQAVVDLDFLFDEVIRNRRPYDVRGLAAGPEFRAMGTNLETGQSQVLKHFDGLDDLMKAVRASCSLPFLSGDTVSYKGVPMADGGLTASIPYKAALDEGATDVLALRSCPATERKRPYTWPVTALARCFDHDMADLVAARPALYNEEADFLEKRDEHPNVVQIAPPEGMAKIARLEHSVAHVRKGLHVGMTAAALAFGLTYPAQWDESVPRLRLHAMAG